MKKSRVFPPLVPLLPLLLALLSSAPAAADDLAGRLQAAVQRALRAPLFRDVQTAVGVRAVKGEDLLVGLQEDQPMIPASAVKILVAAAALHHFGPDFVFSTPLLTDEAGHLYLQGRGDPALTSGDLEKAAADLRRMGLTTVRDIVYDDSFLQEQEPRYPPNARHFYAPPSALTIDGNKLDLDFHPGPPAALALAAPCGYARLEYRVQYVPGPRPGRPVMEYERLPAGDRYTVTGTIGDWDVRNNYLKLCVTRPGLYAATRMREACLRAGIAVSGSIRRGPVPARARLRLALRGAGLPSALTVMNRESDNVLAELLSLDLGACFVSAPGTVQKGLGVVRRYCETELGFSPGGFVIADACGLAPQSRVSARQFLLALNRIQHTHGQTFLQTMARQGVDSHALKPPPPPGVRAYVKSGTLSLLGVNTLVGYIVRERSGETYSFAILCQRRHPDGELIFSGTLVNPILSALIHEFAR